MSSEGWCRVEKINISLLFSRRELCEEPPFHISPRNPERRNILVLVGIRCHIFCAIVHLDDIIYVIVEVI